MYALKEGFASSFDVQEEIGKGHFAVVKRCVCKNSGLEYAGKFIRKKRVCRGVPIEDIQREIELLSQLDHSTIVKLHEAYDNDQCIVLMLDLVSGGELHHYVTESGTLSEDETIHIMKQVLDGLSYLHSRDIAHLDLKPENVLLIKKEPFPSIKLIDFGLSHRLNTICEMKTLFGTPEFVAPEVVNFEPLSLATDMWAVGVVTFILLSGTSPFLGNNVQETYSNVSSAIYEFDSPTFDTVTDLAKDFISKLLVKDPKKRDTVWDSIKHSWLSGQVTEFLPQPETLSSAISEGNLKLFEELLHSGKADIHQVDRKGQTALHQVAIYGRPEMCQLLLMYGANLGDLDYHGDTALIHAARHARLAILSMLLKAGASLSTQNNDGDTALHIAAAWGELTVVKILAEAGALLHISNQHGMLPLHMAISKRQVVTALYLIQRGTDLDIVDADGNAAIHLAVREGLLPVVQALCSSGASLDNHNNQGLCPIHIAARSGLTDIVRTLCLAGCNTEAGNADGFKAEITALKLGHNHISELLNNVKCSYSRDTYIKQLLPNGRPLPRFNLQILGHSSVGKSTLVDTLKIGFLGSLFRKTKVSVYPPILSSPCTYLSSQNNSPCSTHIELDSTSTQNSLNFDLYSHTSTKGIDVQQTLIPGVGQVTMWDFSGQDTYFCFYHHVLTSCSRQAVTVLVFSLADSPTVQYRQCCFWLSFLQARVPPLLPLGSGGKSAERPMVILVATHADLARTSRNTSGDYQCPQVVNLLNAVRSRFQPYFEIHSTPIILDSRVPNTPGLKTLKAAILQSKNTLWKAERTMTGFCDGVLNWLPTVRRTIDGVPVVTWECFIEQVRKAVNPLASKDHFRVLLAQLQLMGEVMCIQDLIVLSPSWLCGQALGQLLSVDFIAHARTTGCYTVEDFQAAFPEADSLAMLQVLEALQLCIQCENEGELEFEFPLYNLVERLDGLWEPSDPRYCGGVYGGVRLGSPQDTVHLLHSIFSRLQVELRRAASGCMDWQADLYQWYAGSKMCVGSVESLITLEKASGHNEFIEIKVRGPPQSSKSCLLFLEELLSIVDTVLFEVTPGLWVERSLLCGFDLSSHTSPPHSYSPEELMTLALSKPGLQGTLVNPNTGRTQSLLDALSFGAPNEAKELLSGPEDMEIDVLSDTCFQVLASLLDPPHPHGKDWCLLAVQLGLTHQITSIEAAQGSRTFHLLKEYSSVPGSTIATLFAGLNKIGREDVFSKLSRMTQFYQVLWEPESVQTPTQS